MTREQLTLNLQLNNIGYEGACGLGELKVAPALQQLTLHLQNNKIGDEEACGLGELKAWAENHSFGSCFTP